MILIRQQELGGLSRGILVYISTDSFERIQKRLLYYLSLFHTKPAKAAGIGHPTPMGKNPKLIFQVALAFIIAIALPMLKWVTVIYF